MQPDWCVVCFFSHARWLLGRVCCLCTGHYSNQCPSYKKDGGKEKGTACFRVVYGTNGWYVIFVSRLVEGPRKRGAKVALTIPRKLRSVLPCCAVSAVRVVFCCTGQRGDADGVSSVVSALAERLRREQHFGILSPRARLPMLSLVTGKPL